MRLQRFELTRYGHFTDQSLDFGIESAASDLHVIYGPNEAGKSTLLEALSDLLFGMPLRSTQAHLHDYKALELRASLMQGENQLEMRRFKRSLTDAEGQSLDATSIDLHGLSREAFRSRFSFDSAALESGSDAMLASEGDLGEALFSASAGIPDIQRRLDEIMADTLRFYEPNKTKDKLLPALLAELKMIDEQLKERDVLTPMWKRLKERADDAQMSLLEAERALADVTGLFDRRRRQLSAFGTARRLRQARDTLLEEAGLPTVPSHWLARLRELHPIVIRLEATLMERKQRLKTLDQSLNEESPNERLLLLAERVDELLAQRALIREQSERLAALDDDIADSERRVAAARRDMRVPETQATDAAVPTVGQLSAIDRLTREFQTLANDGRRERENRQQLGADLAALTDTVKPTHDPTALRSRLKSLRSEGFGAELARLDSAQRDADKALDGALASLHPWHGTAEALAALKPPDTQEFERCNQAHGLARGELATIDTAIEETSQRRASLERERSRLVDDQPIDDEHAASVRRQRDQAWSDHVSALDDASSDRIDLQRTARRFIVLMNADDALAERRLRDSDRLGRLRGIDNELAERCSIERALTDDRLEAARSLDDARVLVERLIRPLSLPPATTVEATKSWLQLRVQALRCLDDCRDLERRRSDVLARCEAEATSLRATIETLSMGSTDRVPEDATLDELLDVTDARLERLVAHRESKQRLTERLRLAERACKTHEERERDWQVQWNIALSDSWLTGLDAETVADLLTPLRELDANRSALANHQAERSRLYGIVARFHDSLRQVLREADQAIRPDSTGDASIRAEAEVAALDHSALQAALAPLSQEIRKALDVKKRQSDLANDRLTLANDVTALEGELLPFSRELADMRAFCAVDDLAQLDARLERAQILRATAQEAETLGQDLIEALEVESVDDALSELDSLDRSALATELERLASEEERRREARNERHLQYSRATDELAKVDGDEQVVHLSSRRANLVLEMRERASEALRLRLGREALLDGVRRYRDQHRSDLLTRARDAFVTLTLGRYRDLQTRPDDKGGEQIRAIAADGRSLDAKQLSDGTRFQLYLGLRIAAFHSYAMHRTPLPFVADDVMESFDEERIAAAFELFATMARSGQIIYLTHQRRVVEIARAVAGDGVRIHELPGRT